LELVCRWLRWMIPESARHVFVTKDGNGPPIPDTRRVFDPLGEGDGIIFLPAGI
jgi:hypothetical protein